jgi:hypothetical protein
MKLTILPHWALMILSLIGRGFKSWLTSENSCSGPRTSSGLYVKFSSLDSLLLCVYVGVCFKADYRIVTNQAKQTYALVGL